MDNTDIYRIIGKVLSSEANTDEILILNKWLEEDEQNRSEFKQLKAVWKNTRVRDDYSNKDRVYQNFLRKKDFLNEHHSEKSSISPIPVKNKSSLKNWVRYAAAIAGIFLLGLSYFSLVSKEEPPSNEKPQCLVFKQNPKGQKSKIVLSDGTIVWLNSESEISYRPGFSDTLRAVNLIGEAYFQVAKDHKRPFVVTAGSVSTTALGTEFNVSYYPEDQLPTVFLTEGKVKVEENGQHQITEYLNPGWGFGPSGPGGQPKSFKDKPEKWCSWREGILEFHKADLKTVLRKCERWYNVKIAVKGHVPSNWDFTGKFENEYLENVLISMNYGKDFRYNIENELVTLTFK